MRKLDNKNVEINAQVEILDMLAFHGFISLEQHDTRTTEMLSSEENMTEIKKSF